MPTVQKVQEERHNLCLCAGVFESPYTANFTRLFLWFLTDSHSFYIYLKIIVIIGMSNAKNQ